MNLKVKKMLVDNWIFKHLGEILILNGAIGILINIFYDYLTGKCSSRYQYGLAQILYFVNCIGMIYAGWGWRKFIKVLKKDMEEL